MGQNIQRHNTWNPAVDPSLYFAGSPAFAVTFDPSDLTPDANYLALVVSQDRLDEWEEFVTSVEPTKANPFPGDRILALARAAIELQERRRPKQRERWQRRKRGKR